MTVTLNEAAVEAAKEAYDIGVKGELEIDFPNFDRAIRAAITAYITAPVPPDSVVVRRDDIAAVIRFLWSRNLIMRGDWDVADRLRDAIGDEK